MRRPNPSLNNFGTALRFTRLKRKLLRRDFSTALSDQYVGTLERGIKSPTLEMVEKLAGVLKVHPLTLLTLTYAPGADAERVESVLTKVEAQIETLCSED